MDHRRIAKSLELLDTVMRDNDKERFHELVLGNDDLGYDFLQAGFMKAMEDIAERAKKSKKTDFSTMFMVAVTQALLTENYPKDRQVFIGRVMEAFDEMKMMDHVFTKNKKSG